MTTNGATRRVKATAKDGGSISRVISALQVAENGRGGSELGLLTQLPADAVFEVCGPGFSERTVKVRYNGHLWFVFLQDLQSA